MVKRPYQSHNTWRTLAAVERPFNQAGNIIRANFEANKRGGTWSATAIRL